jgi:flagellar assembly protein FliH
VDRTTAKPKSRQKEPRLRAPTAKELAYREGFDQGYQEGFAQGEKDAQQSMEDRMLGEIALFRAELDSVVRNIQKAADEWCEKAEESLGALSLVIAERILCTELGHSREHVAAIARDVVQSVMEGTSLRVRVNPFDSGIVEARRNEILRACSGIQHLEVVADPNIPSGCVVETDFGMIDARIDSMLARLGEAVRRLG